MTPLQTALLNKIATSETNTANGNPQSHLETKTWANQMIETAEDKGVFSSLVKEGLVEHHHNGCGNQYDATLGMTVDGFAAWKK